MTDWIKRSTWGIAVAFALNSVTLAQIASDDAGNYSGGWTNESNGGNGFGAWALPGASGGTNGFNGAYVGTPTDATYGMTNYAPMLTSGQAFSIYAGGDVAAYQDASRSFASPLTAGNTFSISIAFTFDNGNKGLNLLSGVNEVFNFNINSTGYTWSGGGSAPMTDWPGLRENGVVLDFVFVQTPSGIDYEVSSAQGLSGSGTVPGGAIDSFKLYISDAGGGDPGNLFFNNMLLEEGTPPSLSFSSSSSSPEALGDLIMTLERTVGSVGDTITLVSDNTAAVTVPASINFSNDADSVTFTGTVVSLIAGSAVITATEGANEATFSVNIPLPSLTLSGPDAVIAGTTNTYTITRTGFVGDSVTLGNTNTTAASTPADATFDGSATTTSFDLMALAAGSTDLQVIGDVATSAVFAVTVVALPPTPANIYDDATFYPLGWSNGSNGGNGFSAWTFQSEGGQHLVSDATVNNATNAASLNTGGFAFGLMGGNGGYQEAVRSFASPLGVGDMFTFSFSFQWDDQNRGFDIRSGDETVFNLNIATNGYSLDGVNTAPATDYPGIREFGVLVDVSITATETGFDYAMSSAQDTNLNTSGSVVSSAITGFKFYNSGVAGNGGVLHFNQLSVIPSSNGFLSISGPGEVLDVATPIYTLTRNSATLVADNVNVGSSDTNVIASPGIVNFEPGELSVSFRANTLAAGSANFLVIATGADPASLAVDVTAGPAGVYDQGAYYYGTWQDGDNNGKGFGAWSFNHNQGSNGFAGVFIGDPANSGISGMDSASFGFYANPVGSGANAEVTRSMPALQVGEAFSFVWGLNYNSGDAGSNRGFDLNVGSTNLINMNMGDNSAITLNGSTMLANYGTQAITITIAHETAGNLRVIATGRDGSESYTSALIPVSGAPDNFKFYFNDTPEAAEHQMYVNNFLIDTYSGPPATEPFIADFMFASGVPTVTIATDVNNSYTLVYTTNLLAITTVNPPVLGEWETAATVSGTGDLVILTDTNELIDASRIYGILIQPDN